jgi:Trk K+ transport system NAD-binding subunit
MSNNKADNRSYGQGASGEVNPTPRPKVGFWTKARYSFDNSIAKSSAFVFYLFLAFALLSVFVVLTKYTLYSLPGILPEGTLPPKPIGLENFFDWFASLYTPQPPQNWADRVVFILNWVITISIAASVTAFFVAAINRAFAKLRKGKSPIIDSNHTLILGWSNRVFPILKELAAANANARNARVVILSNLERDFMEDEIESRAEGLGKLKVITRSGDPTNPTDLKRLNLSNSKSVIILDADEAGDATVVSTVLAVKSVNTNPNLKVIAELDDANTSEALVSTTNGQVIAIRSHDVIARVTAQASRQPGLAAVALDLLDFGGDEIYFQAVPALAGKTYREALVSFNEASIIGLAHADGSLELNPKGTTKLKVDDKIIAVAEDDDKVVFTGPTDPVVKAKPAVKKVPARKAEHMLIIGWSGMGRTILAELAPFMVKGSTVHIIGKKDYTKRAETENLNFGNLKTTFAYTSGDLKDILVAASAKHYDQILVLGYRKGVTVADADALTMLTMLQLNQLFEQDGNGVDPTRLVAEILDSSKAEIARVAAVDDLVVSDNLAALLIAQISENTALAPVFADLFDVDGASLNLKPIEYFADLGKDISYGELVAAAGVRGDSAIGIRIAANAAKDGTTGVELNPSKHYTFKPAAGDGLVVVGNLE